MAQRFYFDTSVFGGVFDAEFEEESFLIFEKVNLGQIKWVYSDLTERELSDAPARVQRFFWQIDDGHKETVTITPDAIELAMAYIKEKS